MQKKLLQKITVCKKGGEIAKISSFLEYGGKKTVGKKWGGKQQLQFVCSALSSSPSKRDWGFRVLERFSGDENRLRRLEVVRDLWGNGLWIVDYVLNYALSTSMEGWGALSLGGSSVRTCRPSGRRKTESHPQGRAGKPSSSGGLWLPKRIDRSQMTAYRQI